MAAGITEIVGLFLLVVGACCGVAAAALVSVALALAVAAAFLLFAGVLVVYVANAANRTTPSRTP